MSRSLCSIGTAVVFLTFLAASAPHRVHHLLENLPPPKTERRHDRGLSLSAAPNHQGGVDRSPESKTQTSAHDHGIHDHSSHAHHHGKNVKHHHHNHAHKHSHHTHSQAPSPAPSESAAEPHQGDAEPLHANAPKRDAHHDNSAETNCIVQAAAQHAHFAPVESAEIAFFENEFDNQTRFRPINFTSYDPSPCSQRAPPRL